MLKIDHQVCNLCGLCQKSCPFGAISAGEDKVAVDERCTLCGACVNVCPQSALSIERRQASPEELARYQGVFVWTECEEREQKSTPRKVVYELLTHGRTLADRLGQPLTAVALGNGRMQGLERLCHQGADRVICCRHDLLGGYSTDGFTTALAAVVAKEKPSVLLFGAPPTAATWPPGWPPACGSA
jgi:electron transfer flavoprotein alpha subunit